MSHSYSKYSIGFPSFLYKIQILYNDLQVLHDLFPLPTSSITFALTKSAFTAILLFLECSRHTLASKLLHLLFFLSRKLHSKIASPSPPLSSNSSPSGLCLNSILFKIAISTSFPIPLLCFCFFACFPFHLSPSSIFYLFFICLYHQNVNTMRTDIFVVFTIACLAIKRMLCT